MNRSAIMNRAWAIFRATYRYGGKGGVPFQAIGFGCFAACLRTAWKEWREARALAAIPAAVKAHRIETLRGRLEDLAWMDNYRQAEAFRISIETELSRLA